MITITVLNSENCDWLANRALWIMAVHNRTRNVIGMLSLTNRFHNDGRTIWLNDLFVHPVYRRSGVARRLLAAAEFYAPRLVSAEDPTLNAGVSEHDDASRALFKRCAFRQHCKYEAENGDQALWLFKPLKMEETRDEAYSATA